SRGPDRDDAANGIRIGGATAFPNHVPRGFLAAGAGDGINWNLRGNELPRDSADARVRHPAELGSNPRRCAAAGTWAGGYVDRRGYVFGASGVCPAGTTDHEVAFWNFSARSAHVRGGSSITRSSGASGELYPGATSHADRSDCGLEIRVTELPSAAPATDDVGEVCFARRIGVDSGHTSRELQMRLTGENWNQPVSDRNKGREREPS